MKTLQDKAKQAEAIWLKSLSAEERQSIPVVEEAPPVENSDNAEENKLLDYYEVHLQEKHRGISRPLTSDERAAVRERARRDA